jgi:hypothetical protein
MEPTVVVGGALLLLMMLGGGKKKGKHGPLQPSDEPTPLPEGHDKGPSDELPGGTKKGHLPKGKGYAPPSDMTTGDLWISPDCQAYVIGKDYYPTLAGMDAYDWYRDIGLARDSSPTGVEAAELYYAKTQDDEPWQGEIFPEHQATVDLFALQVLAEASPLCAATVPRFEQYDYYDDWEMAFHFWLTQYPALGELLVAIIDYATFGGEQRTLEDWAGDTRVDLANFFHAYEDWGGIGFEAPACPSGQHPDFPQGLEPGQYVCVPD